MLKRIEKISAASDTLDVRDIIARYEALDAQRDALAGAIDEAAKADDEKALDEAKSALATWDEGAEFAEHKKLCLLLDELKDYRGDEQWRGGWSPIALVADSYFEDYARELADDYGMVKRGAKWPNNHIDWAAAADELKGDYSPVDFDGVTFWYR